MSFCASVHLVSVHRCFVLHSAPLFLSMVDDSAWTLEGDAVDLEDDVKGSLKDESAQKAPLQVESVLTRDQSEVPWQKVCVGGCKIELRIVRATQNQA